MFVSNVTHTQVNQEPAPAVVEATQPTDAGVRNQALTLLKEQIAQEASDLKTRRVKALDEIIASLDELRSEHESVMTGHLIKVLAIVLTIVLIGVLLMKLVSEGFLVLALVGWTLPGLSVGFCTQAQEDTLHERFEKQVRRDQCAYALEFHRVSANVYHIPFETRMASREDPGPYYCEHYSKIKDRPLSSTYQKYLDRLFLSGYSSDRWVQERNKIIDLDDSMITYIAKHKKSSESVTDFLLKHEEAMVRHVELEKYFPPELAQICINYA